jgi:hypothetical protein
MAGTANTDTAPPPLAAVTDTPIAALGSVSKAMPADPSINGARCHAYEDDLFAGKLTQGPDDPAAPTLPRDPARRSSKPGQSHPRPDSVATANSRAPKAYLRRSSVKGSVGAARHAIVLRSDTAPVCRPGSPTAPAHLLYDKAALTRHLQRSWLEDRIARALALWKVSSGRPRQGRPDKGKRDAPAEHHRDCHLSR